MSAVQLIKSALFVCLCALKCVEDLYIHTHTCIYVSGMFCITSGSFSFICEIRESERSGSCDYIWGANVILLHAIGWPWQCYVTIKKKQNTSLDSYAYVTMKELSEAAENYFACKNRKFWLKRCFRRRFWETYCIIRKGFSSMAYNVTISEENC